MRVKSSMSVLVLSALLAASVSMAPAQAQPALPDVAAPGNSTLIGSAGQDLMTAAVAHPGGGAVLTGAWGEGGSFLSRVDASGGVVWTKQLPNRRVSAVAVGSGGGIVVAGGDGAADATVDMFDGSGAPVWSRVLSSRGRDDADAVAVDSLGRIYVAGRTEGVMDGSLDADGGGLFVARLSSTAGTPEWVRQRQGVAFNGSQVHLLNLPNELDVVRLAYVSNGALVVHRIAFAANDSRVVEERRHDIRAAPYAPGKPTSDAAGNIYWPTSDCFDGRAPRCPALLKSTSDGVVVWESSVPEGTSGGWSSYSNAVVAPDGSVYVSGWASWGFDGNPDGDNDDPILVRYDSDGRRAWSKQYNLQDWNFAGPVLILSDGATLFTANSPTGFRGEAGHGGLDVVVTRLGGEPSGPRLPVCSGAGAGGWSFSAHVSSNDGLVLDAAAFNGRAFSKSLSAPYLDASFVAGKPRQESSPRRIELTPVPIGAHDNIVGSTLTDFHCVTSGPGDIFVRATYMVDDYVPPFTGSPPLAVTQEYRFRAIDEGHPCEPSGTSLCARFWPTLRYDSLLPRACLSQPGSRADCGPSLGRVRTVQRMEFKPDSKEGGAVDAFRDRKGPALTDGTPSIVDTKGSDGSMKYEDIDQAFTNGKRGDWDSIHQSPTSRTTKPGINPQKPKPGCAYCVHMHWAWADLGRGAEITGPVIDNWSDRLPQILDGSKQIAVFGVVRLVDSPEEVDPVAAGWRSLVNKKADNAALLRGHSPVVFWEMTSDRPTDSTFPVLSDYRHGGNGAIFFGGAAHTH